MPSNKKRHNPLKSSSDIFAEEKTSAEMIMDTFVHPSEPVFFSDEDFQNLPELAQKAQQINPDCDPKQDEAEILQLLDKFYNGDRELPPASRYKNKETYKHMLIQKFRRWGMIYVEKKHYSLSRPEKHLIRIDFYGTVNKPRPDQNSISYLRNRNDFAEPQSRKEKKRNVKNPAADEKAKTDTPKKYELGDYNLDLSPAWRLMRTFPRFHMLENKIRIQMFRQKLNPEVIPYLNIYDYSDILYNYFKREDTKEGESVTIFLGARRSFIKDVFLKQEKWLRNFFKRHNYDERYYEALIKSAQGRGVTCNLILKSSSRDFVYDYIRNRRRHFAAYIREQAQSGNHIQNIIEHLETQGKPLTDEMRNFIAANENSFRDHLSRKHITGRHVNAVFELLEEPKFPLYLKENLKSLITGNEKAYTDFLLNKGLSSSEVKSLLDKIKTRPADNLDAALPSEFARQNPELFKAGLQKENRDENYIKFAFNVLNPPPLPEYVQESLLNFIIANEKDAATHNNPDTAMVRDVAENGITPDNYPAVRKYVLKNRKEYSDYYKQNNILTYQELNEQLTDITNFMIKTRGIPLYAKDFARQFIGKNRDVFRYWYSNFQIHKHQDAAESQHKRILQRGLSADDFDSVSRFIGQRTDLFSDFCREKGLETDSREISEIFKTGNFFLRENLIKFPDLDKISRIKELTEQFIRRNGYIYRRSLIQQRISEKEKEAELILKKVSRQGITNAIIPLAHKFILNNKHLFSNDLYNGTQDKEYADGIIKGIRTGTAAIEIQNQTKNFISHRRSSFIAHISNPENIETYIDNTLRQLDEEKTENDTAYWSLQYILLNQNDFENYLRDEKIGEENIQTFKDGIQKFKLSQNIGMVFEKGGLSLQFNDGTSLAVPNLSVHHKWAVQDSFEQFDPQNENAEKINRLFQPLKETAPEAQEFPNLAAANYFSNLCAIIDDPYHIRFFHGMDRTEKFDNCERYIGRLYPADPNLIFFGGLAPEDQLSYDYSRDPRTKRYRSHTETVTLANRELQKSEQLSPETVLYIITGSRQGRR